MVENGNQMDERLNQFQQPIGFELDDWEPRPFPPRTAIEGRNCRVEPLNVNRHGDDLSRAFVDESQPEQWTYLAYGPFENKHDFLTWLTSIEAGPDPLFHSVIEQTSKQAVGLASYLRIEPRMGVIEVGHIHFSPALQQSTAATEFMYLMMRRVFDELGYRRYEWKCDALNTRSRTAAERLGFRFEGVFRQAAVYKGRNRDTAWYSIVDKDWPAVSSGFEQWLSDENFDENNQQRKRLSELMTAE